MLKQATHEEEEAYKVHTLTRFTTLASWFLLFHSNKLPDLSPIGLAQLPKYPSHTQFKQIELARKVVLIMNVSFDFLLALSTFICSLQLMQKVEEYDDF